ncbi:hypothetical protein [Nocardiopsis xinjiangensis]|uniref:hypothetical protein n=1 Tax=Nocardiopsis xinjiangensis TaxID=124285 RepID=UPI000376147B|nr:hypothetical protein [Nocardiopsis xinjiangensis]
MAENTDEPPSREAAPPERHLWWIQAYGQNNPRQYARRAGLVSAGLVLLFVVPAALLLLLPRDGIPPELAWPAVGALAAVALLGAGLFHLFQRMFRRVLGVEASPEDAGPHHRKAANRQVRRGWLSGHPEVDALARRLSVQAERVASLRYVALFMALMLVNLLNLGLQMARGPVTAAHAMLVVITLAFLVAFPLLACRRRRRAQALRKAYDERYGRAGICGAPERREE